MIPVEPIKQFLLGTIVPVITGAAVTWIAGTKVLAVLHVSTGSAAQAISGVVTFAVVCGLSWLTAHHILSGHYTPPAKASAGK